MKYMLLPGDTATRLEALGVAKAHKMLRCAGLMDGEIAAIRAAADLHSRTSGPFSRGFIIPLSIGIIVNFVPGVSNYFVDRPVLNSAVLVGTILLAILLKVVDTACSQG
jgi:hypothetical protein